MGEGSMSEIERLYGPSGPRMWPLILQVMVLLILL